MGEFMNQFAKLFDRLPELESFSWFQYPWQDTTIIWPPDVNGEKGDELDSGREYDSQAQEYIQVRPPSYGFLVQEDIIKVLAKLDRAEMANVFGQPVTVTVHRPGPGKEPRIVVDDNTDDS